MSPIFVRPVREQLEHDRLVRFLQQKYKRKFEVAANMGDEQVAPVKVGAVTVFPDLVLTAARKIAGTVEVETGESVNNLEALAQWVHLSRARVPFHLYVPVPMYEAARRLCDANQAKVSEVWTYRPAADGFDLVRMTLDPSARTVARPEPTRPAPVAAPKVPSKPNPPAPPAPAKAKPAPAVSGKAKAAAAKPSKPAAKAAKPAAKTVKSKAKAEKKAPARSAAKAAKRKK